MDSARFDALVKSVASSTSRRRVLAGLAGSALGLIGVHAIDARTCTEAGTMCREHANCCSGLCGPKDRLGRRRCRCQTSEDCPTPPRCHAAVCAPDGTCTTVIIEGADCDDDDPCPSGIYCVPTSNLNERVCCAASDCGCLGGECVCPCPSGKVCPATLGEARCCPSSACVCSLNVTGCDCPPV